MDQLGLRQNATRLCYSMAPRILPLIGTISATGWGGKMWVSIHKCVATCSYHNNSCKETYYWVLQRLENENGYVNVRQKVMGFCDQSWNFTNFVPEFHQICALEIFPLKKESPPPPSNFFLLPWNFLWNRLQI